VPEVCRRDAYFTEFQKLLAGRAHQLYKSFVDKELRECPTTGLETCITAEMPTPLNPETKEHKVGTLVLRHRLEPIRGEREVRFKDVMASQRVAKDLNVCQTPESLDKPRFRIRAIPRRRLANVFAAETKISEPFHFDLELRKILIDQGPTDDASLPYSTIAREERDREGNIAEMATEHFFANRHLRNFNAEYGIAEHPLHEEGCFN